MFLCLCVLLCVYLFNSQLVSRGFSLIWCGYVFVQATLIKFLIFMWICMFYILYDVEYILLFILPYQHLIGREWVMWPSSSNRILYTLGVCVKPKLCSYSIFDNQNDSNQEKISVLHTPITCILCAPTGDQDLITSYLWSWQLYSHRQLDQLMYLHENQTK